MGGAASQHENELVFDVLRIAEPAFAVNGKHQIVAWNDAAERLLGIQATDIIGARCFEALAARAGPVCADCGACPVGAAYQQRGEPLAELAVTLVASPDRRLRLTTLAAHTAGGQSRIVHLIREEPAGVRGDAPRTVTSYTGGGSAVSSGKHVRPVPLTTREYEVLRLLGAGHSTDEMAAEMNITRVTARNHVNKVLDKLGANSRLQAVVIASQLGLL